MSSRKNNIGDQVYLGRSISSSLPAVRPPAGEAEGVWSGAEPYIRTLKFVSSAPKSRRMFFTVKNNNKPWTMDRCRKWLKQFTSNYIVVQSPHKGIHHHGVFTTDVGRTIRYCKGIHMLLTPLGEPTPKEVALYASVGGNFVPPPAQLEKHPILRGKNVTVGRLLMAVCREIDNMKSSLLTRVKARKKRAKARTELELTVKAAVDYLKKNFDENEEPEYYKHLLIKVSQVE